jgi:hypothetical protein
MPSKHPLGGNPGEEDPLNHYTPSACRNLNPVMATQILVDPNNGLRIQFLTPVKPNQATRLVLLRNSDSIPLPLNLSDTLRLLHEWSATTGLTSSFIPGEIYTLLCEGWESCNGTKSPLQILPVGIGIQADSSQVFISEVYPRPLHTDYPWVECCNQSTKVLDRSRMWFFRTGPAGEVLEGTVLGQNLEVWFPGQCLLLSRNPNFIELESLSPCRVQYSFSIGEISSIKHSLDFSSPILNLPALPKTGAFLCIQNQFGQTLDRVAYHDSCFHPWAGNLDGRSLERWPYDKVYTGIQHPATQWMSSSTQNRASPGCFTRTLSQGSSEPSNTRNRRKFLAVALTVSNSRINPQNLDWIRIGLKFKDPNTVQQARVSIHISDMLGRIVTHLCKDEWADDKSVWSWDGRMGHGSNRPHGVIVPDGPYAVCMNWQSADSQNGWDLTEIYVWRSR